ncbi:unnamed protein product [Psylliodes chrysocephalus]|uniref:Uncharacterized protein n=1 Tax=Psylliodes chrysocephalus TaxID=3402493 RepID=A0A9P0DC43_9CUCU|nr:unnamed protein product [Psylliodes chrysocephala]
METTPDSLDPEVTPRTGNDSTDTNILIISTVVPVSMFVIIFVAVWRVNRRIRRGATNRRSNNLLKSSVYIIPSHEYQPKSILRPDVVSNPPQLNTLDAESGKKQKKKGHLKIKIASKKTKNQNYSTGAFPRDPIYRNQESPSYIVPFSALPHNFDFSLKTIEVHSDFVVIKDLDVLHSYWYETDINKEEYQKPPSLNPNFRP